MRINSLNYILIFFFILGVILNLSSIIEFFPDFYSYKHLFQLYNLNEDWIQSWKSNFFFITRNVLFNNIYDPDLAYLVFRCLIYSFLILSITIFFNNIKKSIDNISLSEFIFICLAILILIVDFGLIRLRSGYSISFFIFGIYFYKRNIKSLALIFLALSFNTHFLTFSTLLFFYSPFIYKNYINIFSNIYFVSLLNLLFIVSGIISHEYFRGPLIQSDINNITFLFLFIIPSFYVLLRFKLSPGYNLNLLYPNFLFILTSIIFLFKILDLNFIYGEGFLRIIMLTIVLSIFNLDNFKKDKIYHFYLIFMYFLYELKILLWL